LIHSERPYRGRFAPSPTGDLHFGSLIAAVASFLEARHQGGQWLIRIEDIDPPREVEGSARRILDELARLGMTSDESVLYQSTRIPAYEEAIECLLDRGEAYWCGCSRSDIPPSGIYPGTCREGLPAGRKPRSVRLKVTQESILVNDRIQGPVQTRLDRICGDFVIRRADGLPAYQLAVVVDDSFQRITDIVRGADLLDSTPRQVLLQARLGLETPEYAHLPVVLGDAGTKLSKRLNSDPITRQDPAQALRAALQFLGQQPPQTGDLQQLWDWARTHWNIARVPTLREVPLGSFSP
jgi:glutamyl-Q tRNA(Asp) synthetase